MRRDFDRVGNWCGGCLSGKIKKSVGEAGNFCPILILFLK
jgi:hypothetical protein